MVYAYMRQIPNVSPLVEQQRSILTFALTKGVEIEQEVVEYATRNLPIGERSDFETFLQSLKEGDTVLVSAIEILSDKVEELIKVIHCVLSHNVNLWLVDSELLINKETQMVDIFPLLDTLRQEEKVKSHTIGRPKGSKSSSKFDIYQSQIIAYLSEGMNVSAIARELGVSRSSLKDYIESRGIKELVNGAWIKMQKAKHIEEMDNIILICPFEKENRVHNKRRA